MYDLFGTVSSAFGTIASADIYIDVNRDTALNGNLSNTSDDVKLDTVADVLQTGTPWAHDDPPWESGNNPDTFEVYAVANILGTQVVSDLSDPNAVDECPPVQVTSELVITKECITCLFDNGALGGDDVIAVEVRVAGTVTNNGNVPVLNVVVTDSDAGSKNIGNIGVGETVNYTFDYAPNSVTSNDPDAAEWSNSASAQGTLKLVGGSVTSNEASDTCELCLGTEGRILPDPGGLTCNEAWPG